MSDSPRFGVNYVPSQGWWYSWLDWDDEAVARDFAAIASIGLDHVRVHCLWPVFQPNPKLVSPRMLAQLRSLLDAADAAGLDVIVTVFNGWLSGFDFRPEWVGDGVNIFTERAVVDAQRLLLSEIADTVGQHPRFLGFDLANEPSVLATPTKNVTSVEDGDAWLAELLGYCEELVPGALHSVGMDHMPWITDHDVFSRPALGTTGTLTPIHAWIFFTGALERYGPDATGTLHVGEYLLELAKAYHRDPGRQVWLQEYGVAPEWLASPHLEDFVTGATRIAASVEGLWGITWWCSHDIARDLDGFINLEYDLGLFTVDNELKPTGALLRDAIRDIRAGGSRSVQRPVALVLPDEIVPDLAFADEFFSLIDSGVRPSIVLASQAHDDAYLASRGITRLVRTDASVGARDE